MIQTRSWATRKKLMAKTSIQQQFKTLDGAGKGSEMLDLSIMIVTVLSASYWHQSLHRDKMLTDNSNQISDKAGTRQETLQNVISTARKEGTENGGAKK